MINNKQTQIIKEVLEALAEDLELSISEIKQYISQSFDRLDSKSVEAAIGKSFPNEERRKRNRVIVRQVEFSEKKPRDYVAKTQTESKSIRYTPIKTIKI